MNCRGGRRRRRAQRVYRVLVRLYPAAHRRAFGEQMVQMFGDHYRDAVLTSLEAARVRKLAATKKMKARFFSSAASFHNWLKKNHVQVQALPPRAQEPHRGPM